MGYYTRYELKISPDRIDIWEKIISSCEDIYYAVGNDGESGERCKWYDHEDDMISLSKEFPDVIFELHGEGQEPGDIWKKYFKDGKKQVCMAEFTFPPMREDGWE